LLAASNILSLIHLPQQVIGLSQPGSHPLIILLSQVVGQGAFMSPLAAAERVDMLREHLLSQPEQATQ
jgi:hypothetical protein